ncbi:hypothetical protein [Streptomyces sp. TRM68367]|uniref:hypothetical protein n=1 Tax=Streptomyces sp. TRM68367 TaxID=2758415 RepID=UPI00165A6DCD|nr:hypothetical protein [Streptomyces sp. TRM68367]MBC9728662.1 hypothetical protein [Streptomyces sp. TRM68367]
MATLIIAAMVYDNARLITPNESRCPPLAPLRVRRAALEDAAQWGLGLRMHGQIAPAAYQQATPSRP